MAKSSTERKAAQRERQRNAGVIRLDLQLDAQEYEMVLRNCSQRRPGKTAYSLKEYLQLLIRADEAALRKELAKLNKQTCGKCGEQLPVDKCCMAGDSQCWLTHGGRKLNLPLP